MDIPSYRLARGALSSSSALVANMVCYSAVEEMVEKGQTNDQLRCTACSIRLMLAWSKGEVLEGCRLEDRGKFTYSGILCVVSVYRDSWDAPVMK